MFSVCTTFGAGSHDLGTTHCPGQLTDPGLNFASAHGLTPVTDRLAEVTFLHVNRTQKLHRGKSSLAYMLIINVQNKFLNRKFHKAPEIGKHV